MRINRWWSKKISKKQQYVYYSLSLIILIPTLLTAMLTKDSTFFAGIFFFFIGLYAFADGVYGGFYLKEYPKIWPNIIRLQDLSAQLRGILQILISLLALYAAFILLSNYL